MSCDSWIFVQKNVSESEDRNEQTTERKALWNYSSWSIGELFASRFGLSSGDYRSAHLEDLITFAEDCISHFLTKQECSQDLVNALQELK